MEISDPLQSKLKQKVEMMMFKLLMDQPFYGTIAASLGLYLTDNDAFRAATDSVNFFFNEKFVEESSLEVLHGTMIHEVMHVAKKHSFRKQHRDHELFNVACDFQINDEVKSAGISLPDNICLDKKYTKDMLEEDIYDDLMKNGTSGKKYVLLGDVYGPGELSEGQMFPNGQVGEAANQGTVTQWANNIDRALERAYMTAKSCGKLPGWAEAFIYQNRKSYVDWRSKLRRAVVPMLSRGGDLTWERLVKRMLFHGNPFPSDHSRRTIEIVNAIDTSGSMGAAEVNACLSELNAIIKTFNNVKVHNIMFHTNVWDYQVLDSFIPPTKIESGGTEFAAVTQFIQEEKINPKLLLFMTDMCCPYPAKPKYPVIWMSTCENFSTPPYGEVMKVKL